MHARAWLILFALGACRRGVDGDPVHDVGPPPDAAPPIGAPALPREPADPTSFEGRPIAPTMGHLGADWLSRPERIAEEDPDALHRELALRAGETACDIGAGNGYHSVRLAASVGPRGKVLAIDIQPEMLALLTARARAAGLDNVESVLAHGTSLGVADGVCDLELLVDVYHELAEPEPSIAALRRALAPRGRLAIVEFRGEDPEVPIKPEHKMTRAQLLRELEPRGFRLLGEYDGLPWQHLLVFERDDAPAR